MTFEQLSIFVAVAEREHLTKAAAAIGLTPSAVSASIKALEAYYNVRLFERVGRGIELTPAGRVFLDEARATLARARSAALVLSELGGLKRGTIDVYASQTIANYWLPQRLVAFHAKYPAIEIRLTLGNTSTVTAAVVEGLAELGFIEGAIDVPTISAERVASDELVVTVAKDHPLAGRDVPVEVLLRETPWVMREPGSGTRSQFESALAGLAFDPAQLDVALTLPSNEAVLSAVRAGHCAAALSRSVVAPFISSGEFVVLNLPLPPRAFMVLRHRERHPSAAARELIELCMGREASQDESTQASGAKRRMGK